MVAFVAGCLVGAVVMMLAMLVTGVVNVVMAMTEHAIESAWDKASRFRLTKRKGGTE